MSCCDVRFRTSSLLTQRFTSSDRRDGSSPLIQYILSIFDHKWTIGDGTERMTNLRSLLRHRHQFHANRLNMSNDKFTTAADVKARNPTSGVYVSDFPFRLAPSMPWRFVSDRRDGYSSFTQCNTFHAVQQADDPRSLFSFRATRNPRKPINISRRPYAIVPLA